jgi:murein DD-endopeptidase MepM/ murein hydrolase activator NlpD
VQHRAQRHAPGRHRRDHALHSHRAPRTPVAPQVLGGRGRHAVLTAALIAGVGAAAVASGGHAQAKPATPAAAPAAARTEIDPAPVTSMPALAVTPSVEDAELVPPTLSAVPALRKARPVPVVLAHWVNPLPEAVVTSCFGMRWGRLHAGVDLAAATGTEIHAAGAGVVAAAGLEGGYGNAVLIDHGDGYLTHYGHMSAITVTVGQTVVAGQQIGNEGSTGHSTGPHLHFEVHQGQYKNPIEPTQWLHEHGVDIPGCVAFAEAPKQPQKPEKN